MKSVFGMGVIVSLVCVLTSVTTSGATLCSQPKVGLRSGQPNADGEVVNFAYHSQSYALDVYSGFAAQSNSITANYCIRYEVENKSSVAVEKFFWPLATIQMDSLPPIARQSILMTRKSDRQPTLDETKLYAFASEEAKTRAYQITQPTKRSDAGRLSRSDSGLDIARVDKSNGVETIELKEPREFSDIGAQYSAPDFEVTAASTAKWDGKNYLISISITRSDAKYIQKIEAPIAYAIYKGFLSRRPDIIAAVFPAIDGLMTNNSFNAQFSEELNGPGELYIVPQPVTFQTPRGRICFLADVYSPVVPPPSWSSCSLFNK